VVGSVASGGRLGRLGLPGRLDLLPLSRWNQAGGGASGVATDAAGHGPQRRVRPFFRIASAFPGSTACSTAQRPGLSRKGLERGALTTDRALLADGASPCDREVERRLPRATVMAPGPCVAALQRPPVPAIADAWVLAPRQPFAPEAAFADREEGGSDRAMAAAAAAVLSMRKPRLP